MRSKFSAATSRGPRFSAATSRDPWLAAPSCGSWVLLAAPVLACTSLRQPCAAPTCSAGYECVANLCEPVGTDPVPPNSTRLSPQLQSFVVMNRAGHRQPQTATLGDENHGDMLLFLEFDDSWIHAGDPLRAFLVLYPAEAARVNREDVVLEAFTLSTNTPSWSGRVTRHPKRVRPSVRALARGGAPIRFDVTPLLRGLEGGEDGIAIVAVDEDGDGTTVSTVGTRGKPPLFEVYVERAEGK
jgi:hypothetical protein